MRAFKQLTHQMISDGQFVIKLGRYETTVIADFKDKVITSIILDNVLPKILKDEKERIIENEGYLDVEIRNEGNYRKFFGSLIKFHGTYVSYHKNTMFLSGAFKDGSSVLRETNEVLGTIYSDGVVEVEMKYEEKHMYTTVHYVSENIIIDSQLKSILPPPTHAAIKNVLRQAYGDDFEKEKEDINVYHRNTRKMSGKNLIYRITSEGVEVIDHYGDFLELEPKVFKYLEAIVKQIIKFHTEFEVHYLSETFMFGDWISGIITDNELGRGRR
jgi:hypothetical protein